MPTDHAEQPWAIRSTLISVAHLDLSVAFYGELGPFPVIAREDRIAVLGDVSPTAPVLILRETQRGSFQARHGQQSLGLRMLTFNVGTVGELDRVESTLRSHDRFTERRHIGDGASEIIRGRDLDNLPLVFSRYATETVGSEYYKAIISMFYSMDA